MPLDQGQRPSGVAEMAAPYHHRKPNSIRAIQRGAAALLERLSEVGHLTEDEAAHLRAGDVDLTHQRIIVRDFDGRVASAFPIPKDVSTSLRVHLAGVRLNHERDRIQGMAGVWVPPVVHQDNPEAGKDWNWYWLFPARHVVPEPMSGRPWRPAGVVPTRLKTA